jgi:hypothetical protein
MCALICDEYYFGGSPGDMYVFTACLLAVVHLQQQLLKETKAPATLPLSPRTKLKHSNISEVLPGI